MKSFLFLLLFTASLYSSDTLTIEDVKKAVDNLKLIEAQRDFVLKKSLIKQELFNQKKELLLVSTSISQYDKCLSSTKNLEDIEKCDNYFIKLKKDNYKVLREMLSLKNQVVE